MTQFVYAYVFERNNQWIVKHCPLCGARGKRAHKHGNEVLGYRVPHCPNQIGAPYQYVLTTDPNLNGQWL